MVGVTDMATTSPRRFSVPSSVGTTSESIRSLLIRSVSP